MTEAQKRRIKNNILNADINGFTPIIIDLLLPGFRGIM